MDKSYWNIKFGIGLTILSAVLYFIHYLVFNDAHHIFVFMVEDIAFIPIEVLIVSLILHKILEEREKKHMLEKLNMLIGLFFNEVGTKLLRILVKADPEKENIYAYFENLEEWDDKEFKHKGELVRNEFQCKINIDKINIKEFADFLKSKRNFLIGLLQNHNLLEHETFTELLTAVFHVEDEFHHHVHYDDLIKDDIEHLRIDIQRAYPLLVYEWIIYMRYLKKEYPYLFSLAIRYNPVINKKDI